MTAPFSIVIPSRNRVNMRRCVNAIRAANETAPIFVIDDGLSEIPNPGGWAAWKPGGNGRVIPGVKPFCFARNVNIGIEAAGRDDVIIMNDDALLLTPNGLSQLAECRRISPTIVSASIDNVLRRPGAVSFACVHIPRIVFDVIGLLDERFCGQVDGEEVYGGEDDDFCFRARLAGFHVDTTNMCKVDHSTLQSTFRPDGKGRSIAATRKRWLEIHGFPMGAR